MKKRCFDIYNESFDDGLGIDLSEDDIPEFTEILESNNWGTPVLMEKDFSIEEILDMPVMGEVQTESVNMDCVGQNDLCEKDSHDNSNHGIFCVTQKDSDCIDIDDLY